MDGNYLDTIDCRLERADTVVMLLLPRRVQMIRLALRTLRHYGQVRDDLGLPERTYLRLFWNAFTYTHRRNSRLRSIIGRARSSGGAVIILDGQKEIDRFICDLPFEGNFG